MGVKWTEEQQKVISLRDRNILVSAAAGSGKTAVLVERILSKITDPEAPVDIDRLLIMTFTRAAAGEMKERIRGAIEKAFQALLRQPFMRIRTMSIYRDSPPCFILLRLQLLTDSVHILSAIIFTS